MFHSWGLNNKINRLRERCLRIVYSDNISSFVDLLDKDESVSIQVKKCPDTCSTDVSNCQKIYAPVVSEIFENEIRITCKIYLNLFNQRFTVFFMV